MNKKSMWKKQVAIVLSIFVLAILASAQTALTTTTDKTGTADLEVTSRVATNYDIGKLLGWRASEIAKEELCFVKDSPYILAMTDAGYAIVGGEAGGKTTESCIDGVSESSGCTIGKGNLLLIHRSKEKPLWFAFFNSETKECIYLEANESVFDESVSGFIGLSDEEVFTTIAKENISTDLLLNETYAQTLGADFGKVFGGNEFSIITIASVWDKGAPYEFMQAAQLHNHICPGLASGYLIIRYLDKNLPLQAGQKYTVIACPPWCKDDAFQAILDATVGKRQMCVKQVCSEQREVLPKDIAGIYIRHKGKYGAGDGLALSFNWTKACEISEFPRSYFKDFASYKWWYARLKMDLDMMDYISKPETLVTEVHSFSITASEHKQLHEKGVDPYEVLGIVKPPLPVLVDIQERTKQLIDLAWEIHDNTAAIADDPAIADDVRAVAEELHVDASHPLIHTAQYIYDYNLEDLKDLTRDPEANMAEINDTIFTIKEYLGECEDVLIEYHDLAHELCTIVPDTHATYAEATHGAFHDADAEIFAIRQKLEDLEKELAPVPTSTPAPTPTPT